MDRKCQVGDVIKANKNWKFGHGDSNGRITVGHRDRNIVVDTKGKKIPIYDQYDKTRPDALYVVEETRMSGGGTDHGPHDVYPDGWCVNARRLDANGNYDPNGEVVSFYQSGCFTCMVMPEDITLVGQMERTFVRKT